MNMPSPMQPTTMSSQPSAMNEQPSGLLTKNMSIGGAPMKHGKSLKTLVIGLLVLIILVAAVVISYGVGYNVAMENAVAGNSIENVQPMPAPGPQTGTVVKGSTGPDYFPASFPKLLNSDVPDNMLP